MLLLLLLSLLLWCCCFYCYVVIALYMVLLFLSLLSSSLLLLLLLLLLLFLFLSLSSSLSLLPLVSVKFCLRPHLLITFVIKYYLQIASLHNYLYHSFHELKVHLLLCLETNDNKYGINENISVFKDFIKMVNEWFVVNATQHSQNTRGHDFSKSNWQTKVLNCSVTNDNRK